MPKKSNSETQRDIFRALRWIGLMLTWIAIMLFWQTISKP